MHENPANSKNLLYLKICILFLFMVVCIFTNKMTDVNLDLLDPIIFLKLKFVIAFLFENYSVKFKSLIYYYFLFTMRLIGRKKLLHTPTNTPISHNVEPTQSWQE